MSDAIKPVAWQWRRTKDSWSLKHTYEHEVRATTDDSEVRALYDQATLDAAIAAERERCVRLEELVCNMATWYPSIDDTTETSLAIEEMRTRARDVLLDAIRQPVDNLPPK